jgi:hypothetical protein
MKKILAAIVLGLMASAAQATTPPNMVSAADPGTLVSAMEFAGYEASVAIDEVGDPMITTELGGWLTNIYFYGCDENTHQQCDSIQLQTGFDRKEPWSAEAALQISEKYRFVSVWLDDEGDPYVRWDIVTGGGIPTKVFLQALREYTLALQNASNLVFAEERAVEE